MLNKDSKRAFTTVELVIVIAVIAILSTILIPVFSNLLGKANDSKAIQNAKNAYTEYLVEHAASLGKYDAFIYKEDDDTYLAILNGTVQNKTYNKGSDVLQEITDSWNYSIVGTGNDKFYAVVSGNITANQSNLTGKSIVFVGDSITAGTYTDKIYWQYLQDTVAFRNVQAMGFPGSCVSATSDYGNKNSPLINRYRSIPNADLIVLFIGTNDYGHHTPLGTIRDTTDESFYGALNVIIPGILKAHPNSQLIISTPIHRYGQSGNPNITFDTTLNNAGYALADYVNALWAVCEKYSVSVIDLFSVSDLDPTDLTIRSKYFHNNDAVHPNANGHKIIAQVMKNYLELYVDSTKHSGGEDDTENTDEYLQYGNRFANNSDTNRVSSNVNLYLEAGKKSLFRTQIIFVPSHQQPGLTTMAVIVM